MTDILAPIQKLVEESAKKDETIRKLEAKLQKYEEILLNRERSSEDMFLIYKNDFGEDSIDIIGRNIREFGELLYHRGHKLIARQESNLEFCIYLASFDGNSDFDESIKTIENLIEKKRKEEKENVNNNWPMNRIVPELKVNNDRWKHMKDETVRAQQTIDEFKTQTQAILNEMKDKYDTMTDKYDTTSEMIQFLQKQGVEREKRRTLKVDRFYAQRELDYIKNSPETLEKMCMRLSVEYYRDTNMAEFPFENIISMDEKKKELIAYFDLLQKKLDGSTEVTKIQEEIRSWMYWNQNKRIYNPTTSEKEKLKKEMKQMLKVENTIGTVHCIPVKRDNKDCHFFFCIANCKIISCNISVTKGKSLYDIYQKLKIVQQWDTNPKFATDLEVSDRYSDYSDYFVHVSTEELMKISNNHKVMRWMTNNFKFLKYNVADWDWLFSMPIIYDMPLQYFEESME